MEMTKVTEKEMKRLNTLVNKALDIDQPVLNTEEIKELQEIIKKIGAERQAIKESNNKEK